MRRILLYEKYIAPFDADFNKAKKRIDSLKMDHDFLHEAVWAMQGWFYGKFMKEKMTSDELAIVDEVTDIFKKIGTAYHTNPVNEKMYRISQINISHGAGTKEIRKINKTKTGPKKLQSWSTTKEGAEWFFNHFVRDQNHSDIPDHSKAWVLLSTESDNLNQLLTFEECMQFLYDIGNMIPPLEMIADRLVSDEMLKLHELICDTPNEVPVKIENILVPPIKVKKKKTA